MKKGVSRKAYGNHWKSAHDNSSTTGIRRLMTKAVSTANRNEGYSPRSLQLECGESGQCKTITFGKPQTTTNADNKAHTVIS